MLFSSLIFMVVFLLTIVVVNLLDLLLGVVPEVIQLMV